MVEDPLQLLRIKCVADEQGDGVLGKLLFSHVMTSLTTAISLNRYRLRFELQRPVRDPYFPRRGTAENIGYWLSLS